MKRVLTRLTSFATIVFSMCFATLCFATSASAKTVNIDSSSYNYGKYVVVAHGVGANGVYDEDLVSFWYLPVYPEITIDDDTGEYYADLEYEADDGTSECNGDVVTVTINIYDSEGNLVEEVSPVTVTQPDTHVRLPMTDHPGITSGTYTAEVIAYDENGEMLYEPYYVEFEYEAIPVPDTGRFFQNLNISKEDYLVTGLIMFFVIGVVAFGVISKNGKKTSKSRRRR